MGSYLGKQQNTCLLFSKVLTVLEGHIGHYEGHYILCVIMCYQIKVMLYKMEITLSRNIGKSLKEFLVKTLKECLPKKLKHTN